MPRDFITADGFGITEACKRYLRPFFPKSTERHASG